MSKFEGAKGPMFGRMTEADFPSDTITLEMEPGYYTAAMRFAVVPADEYSQLAEQRAELLESFGQGCDTLESLTHSLSLPIPDSIHVAALRNAMPNLLALLRAAIATQQRNATGGEG